MTVANDCEEPTARFSPCGQYRYTLRRDLGYLGKGSVLFLMLNPSIASWEINDPTIRRCMGFAKSWGYRQLYVANLSPFRATDPRELAKHLPEPSEVQAENERWILSMAQSSDKVIAAFGAHKLALERGPVLVGRLVEHSFPVYCLGITKQGLPRHPLYVPATAKLLPYPLS